MATTNPDPTSSTTTGPDKAVVDYRLLVERATGRPLATARLNPRPGPQYRHGPERGWCGSTNVGPECHSATFDGFDVGDLAAALDTHTITAAVEAGVGVERPY